MNQYENRFHFDSRLSDEQMKEAVAKFKKLLTDNGAEILNEEIWGLKKLAYNIQKNHQVSTLCWSLMLTLQL